MYRYRLSSFNNKELRLDTCFGDNKGEIKEIKSFRKRSEFPGEFTVGVRGLFECKQVLLVGDLIQMVDPNS
jgi:hypothetical protein